MSSEDAHGRSGGHGSPLWCHQGPGVKGSSAWYHQEIEEPKNWVLCAGPGLCTQPSHGTKTLVCFCLISFHLLGEMETSGLCLMLCVTMAQAPKFPQRKTSTGGALLGAKHPSRCPALVPKPAKERDCGLVTLTGTWKEPKDTYVPCGFLEGSGGPQVLVISLPLRHAQ